MIELFKLEVKLGERVKLILTTGKEPIGDVVEIGSNHILIKGDDGNYTRVFEVLLGGWELMKSVQIPNSIDTQNLPLIEESSSEQGIPEEKKSENIEIEDVEVSIEEKNSLIEDETKNKIGVKIVGKITLDEIETKKNRFPTGGTYRLRQVAKEFHLTISSIVDILRQLNIEVDTNPNSKIDQKAYDIILQNKNQKIIYDISKTPINTIIDNEPLGLKLNSFSELNKLKEKIDINVGQQILPGNAKVKRYGSLHQYGFVSDNDGFDYHFNYSEILDNELLQKLQNFGAEGIQVICQLNNYNGKLIAKRIFLPKTVDYFLSKSEEFFINGSYNDALYLLELILTHFPDDSQSIKLKNKITFKNKRDTRANYPENSFYLLAKIEHKKGNINLAKKYYLQAIDKDDQKSENAIKELAYLLSGESKYDEAIDLVRTHSFKIKLSDPNSFIAYFYEAKKEYPKAIEFLTKIRPKSKNEDLKLSKRLAICYFGTANYVKAEEQINKILRIQPQDTVTNKLKQALDVAKSEGSEEEIESIFKEVEISTLTGGLSNYIYYKLENCKYAGVPESEVQKKNFNEKTLTNLKKYIETIKDGRPRERAEAYLSQAKIEQILDSENSEAINASLARYCTSIAISWATDGRQVDTLKYFLIEAASLEPIYDILRRYIPLYLHSFSLSGFEAKSKIRQNWSELIEEVVTDNEPQAFWFGVLDLLLVNSKFSTQFLTSIYNKADYRENSLKFLMPYIEQNIESEMNKDLFLQLWKKGREKLKREKDTLSAKFLSLKQSKSSEAIIESFLNIKRSLPEWLGQLDRQRIDILNGIIESIIEFNKQQAFEDKERYYNIISNQFSHLKEEIQESPTEFSFNVFISVIDFVDNLIIYEFKNAIETSKPVIKIQIYGEGSINKQTGIVDVQFSISNKKGSAPISYLELNIIEENDIEFIKENNIVNQSLKGGDEKVLKLRLKIKRELIEEGATNLKLNCIYKIRGNEDLLNLEEELTLRFYSISDFEKIENPFAATADSGPVENDSMFYGREEFISNIKESIINSKSKCVIIYGQKRSGKSSVLHHLRKNLNNAPNAFCISFSLGEIIEDLSPKTFYYTILTEIEDSLAILSERDDNIPKYIAPDYSDLSDAPAIMFNDQMKSLKREFNKFPDWSNKKLVLLIDEFTYIYTAIQKGYLSELFMKTWKSFLEKGFFTSVLIGQDIMPKFKAAYPNEFGVTEDKRLSYLKKTDAIKLIEEPIWDNIKNRSRFLGKATEFILDYTSSNPYYVQIFCARLVDYMNDNKAISVTEADVHDVAESFIKGEQSLPADKFDNLITAGDADLDAFNANDVLSALKAIAIASKNLDSCPREAINLGAVEYEENILQDLKDREVLSTPQPGYFKINVRLFKEWLLIN